VSWELESAEERHAEHPDSFWIPPLEWREALGAGDQAQLIFRLRTPAGDEQVERMWVTVSEVGDGRLAGVLESEPMTEDAGLAHGDPVAFALEHVMAILWKPVDGDGWARVPDEALVPTFIWEVADRGEAWTVDAVSIDGPVPVWPDEALARAAGEPARRLGLDELLAWLPDVDEVAVVPGQDDDGIVGPGRRLAADLRAQLHELELRRDERESVFILPRPDPELTRLAIWLDADEDDPEWPPFASEVLWAERVDDDRFRVETIPLFARGVARGDVVEAGFARGTWWVTGVVEPGGAVTVRVLLADGADTDAIRDALHAEGADTQDGGFDAHFAVHAPETATLDRVLKLLEDAEGSGDVLDWDAAD
jgi:hypothetical protein